MKEMFKKDFSNPICSGRLETCHNNLYNKIRIVDFLDNSSKREL